MSEVAVSKKTSQAPAVTRAGEPQEHRQMLSPFMNPFGIMREFASELDRLFRGVSSEGEMQAWFPVMDVRQCNGNLVVSAELPGLKKEEVKVEISDNALIIEGERKQEHKEEHGGYHRWERNYGQFYRSIALPEGAKTDQAKAELKDGVLKVSIPVPEEAKKTRPVPVTG